ncbi:MAG: glutaredoxin 3 [Gammaproteobacteria bacterium]
MKPLVIIYSTMQCPYCDQAKTLLDRKNVAYTEVKIDQDLAERDKMIRLSGRRSVPQIFINNHHVGGYDDLYALERAGALDRLLNQEKE